MLSGPWRRGGYASRQRGQALLAVVVLLGVLVFGYFLSQGALIIASANRKYVGVEDQETRIKRALLQFVQINSRLPCPADPSVALGNATAGYPDANSVFPAVTSCTYPGGVVPWKALGLSLDDVTDPWGRFISYRVYDGSIGLTQAGGMNKVDCDSLNNSTIIDIANNKRTGVTISETARSASGLCNPDHNTLATSFTAGKGLTVTDFGTQHTDVAYVLISHGPSGLGGYVPGGASRMTLPGTTAADYNNTQSQQGAVLTSGAYVGFIKMAGSLSTVTAGGADHYDDVVDYLRIDDVARLASMDARDWPESAASAAPIPAFSAATTADMTSTSSATAFHVSMTTTANAAQQFQATAASDGTVDGAVKFGAAAGNYASCLWAPLAVDLYKAPTATVAAASWSANVITFTTSAAHGLAMGNTVIVTGASPSGYNGSYTLTGAPTSTTFTVANTINPGTWVSGGTVKLSSTLIAGTSWSAGVTSYVTGTAHGLAVGDTVQITNAVSDTSNGGSTVDYNGTFTVATVADSTHFTVADSSTHGLWRSSGTVVKGFRRALMASVQAAFNSSNSGGGLVLGFLPTNGTYINASSSSAIALNPVNNIVSASALLGFATVTLSGPPPFQTGAVVTIAGVPVASLLGIPFSLNGTWTVTNVSGNTFKVGGLLSGPLVLFGAGGAVTSSLCGSASSSRIGWENNGTTDGNLPTPRFAVELDTTYNASRGDPTNSAVIPVPENHAAIDFAGVTHGTMASACAYSAGAYHSPESSVASGTAWSSSGGGTITFDTATNHGLLPNDTVTVAGVSPSGYNGVYVVASIPGGKIFTVAKSTNPGTWSSGGTVTGPATNSLASGTSWSGGTVTFTTALAHNFAEGNTVVITGASPSGYNGTFTVTGVPSSTTFTATLASDPGTWVSGGVFASNDCYTGTSTTWLMDGTSSFHTVRVEVEPRAPACGSTAPLLKFWLLPSSVCSPAFSLASGTSWSDASGSGTITFKTSAAHGYTVGDSVTVAGASPTGYNGTYTVLSVPDTLTFTVANATDPGTWTSGGKPVSTECSAMTGMTAQYQPTHFPATGVHLAQCVPTPSPANAFDSVYFGFTSNNATLGNTQDNVILQNLSSGVIGLP